MLHQVLELAVLGLVDLNLLLAHTALALLYLLHHLQLLQMLLDHKRLEVLLLLLKKWSPLSMLRQVLLVLFLLLLAVTFLELSLLGLLQEVDLALLDLLLVLLAFLLLLGLEAIDFCLFLELLELSGALLEELLVLLEAFDELFRLFGFFAVDVVLLVVVELDTTIVLPSAIPFHILTLMLPILIVLPTHKQLLIKVTQLLLYYTLRHPDLICLITPIDDLILGGLLLGLDLVFPRHRCR